MDNKVTLSYSFSSSGDENLFLTLSTKLTETLSGNMVEWHHAYGRNTHKIPLKTKILPLNPALLERKDLVTRPYCHIFWTDCTELDQYKMNIKPDITSWLNVLSKQANSEWIIVVITGDVLSRLTKAKLQFPRTSITDKVKSDFCSKYPERLHVVHDPNRDSKNSETWAGLNAKVSKMTVRCMEKMVLKYEDQVRLERERRNEKTWDFCSYFLFQEELAFMYEMLDMFKLAQVQYDELDAMFTQYVLNANAGDYAHWLSEFSKPIVRWHSLLLWKPLDSEARQMMQRGQASLIDIRNYLFSRLCHLLFRMGKISEVVERLRNFLHSIATEIDILEIPIPIGAVESWIFMSCLELVEALKRQNHSRSELSKQDDPNIDVTSEKLLLEYASLWNLARLKLKFLGKLCGLMPNVKTTSSHLQIVVDLLAGMGEGEERDEASVSPALVLREALSSKKNFQKHYFELSELAIGTYKHMKHYRAARSIGSDLASYYMLLGEPVQAEGYLVDAVRTYANDGWVGLYTEANCVLAKCYKQMKNIRKYLRLCYALMCDARLKEEEKTFYCDELCSLSPQLDDRTLAVNMWPLASAISIRFLPAQTSFRLRDQQFIEISIFSYAPKAISLQAIHVSLEYSSTTDKKELVRQVDLDSRSSVKNNGGVGYRSLNKKENSSIASMQNPGSHLRVRHPSSTSSKELMINETASMNSDGLIQLQSLHHNESTIFSRPSQLGTLNFVDQREVQDGELAWSGVTCRRAHFLLRRQDSNPSQRNKHSLVTSAALENYDCSLAGSEFQLEPGRNVVKVPLKTDKPGSYQLQQMKLSLHKTFFVLPRIYPVITYAVTNLMPTIDVQLPRGLVCGVVEEILVSINLEDHSISGTNEEVIALDFSSKIRFLEINKTLLVSERDDVVKEIPSPTLKSEGGHVYLSLPTSPDHVKIQLHFLCICIVDEISHKKERKPGHRRTHSAPSGTLSRSPKPTLREGTIPEVKSTTSSDDDVTGADCDDEAHKKTSGVHFNKRSRIDRLENIKNSIRESFRVESSPFKLFRSKTQVDNAGRASSWSDTHQDPVKKNPGNIPSLHLNGDFIEVTLDDDDVSAASSDMRSMESSMVGGELGTLQLAESPEPEDCMEPSVITSETRDYLSVTTSQPDDVIVHKTSPISRPSRSSYTECRLVIETPWESVPHYVSNLHFARPCEFTHAWHFAGTKQRFLSVAVDNVTSTALTLLNPSMHFNNTSKAQLVYLGANRQLVRSGGSCLFVWKIKLPSPAPPHVSVRFSASLLSRDVTVHVDDAFSTVAYNFDIECTQPIYSIKSRIDDEIHSGRMASLHVEVERLQEDPKHEPTANGQQLLMYQVLDDRGRWAVCGKSSGILSFKSQQLLTDGERCVDHARMEVMPLVSGNLHLPFIMLHRYMKRRSSELDERLSSTDSPVMKPPQLKPFEDGEVIYRDQARQVLVLSSEQIVAGSRITKL